VILFIGDGMGFSHVEAATKYFGAPLAMSGASIITDMTTNSLSSGYTDSSASATAMATGTKVYNGSVGMTSAGQELPNFVDHLGEEGVRSGFITSDTLYGGTPAGFLSHAVNRTNYFSVMKGMADSAADLIMGIAPNAFEPLYQSMFTDKGYTPINKMSALSTAPERIISALPAIPAVGTGSSLDQLTVFGLDYLDNNEDGFFLAVEGSAIDTKSHAGESEGMILELLALDRAVQVALKWASNRTDTAIIVTADHETGGLVLGPDANSENILTKMTWTKTTHTTSNVPFFAWGLSEDEFPLLDATIDNTDVYDITMGLLSRQ
jgi:alkaline phosphatase